MVSEKVLYQMSSGGPAASVVAPGRFEKELLRIGRWAHPAGKFVLEVTRERLAKWVENFRRMLAKGIPVPVPYGHSYDPRDNAGFLRDVRVDGDRLVGVLEIPRESDAGRIGSVATDVSVSVNPDFTDGQGERFGEVIEHVAITNYPIVSGQANFVPLSAEGAAEVIRLEMETPARDTQAEETGPAQVRDAHAEGCSPGEPPAPPSPAVPSSDPLALGDRGRGEGDSSHACAADAADTARAAEPEGAVRCAQSQANADAASTGIHTTAGSRAPEDTTSIPLAHPEPEADAPAAAPPVSIPLVHGGQEATPPLAGAHAVAEASASVPLTGMGEGDDGRAALLDRIAQLERAGVDREVEALLLSGRIAPAVEANVRRLLSAEGGRMHLASTGEAISPAAELRAILAAVPEGAWVPLSAKAAARAVPRRDFEVSDERARQLAMENAGFVGAPDGSGAQQRSGSA